VVVVGGGGGGWLESKLSDQLWLSFSLALAKPNKKDDLNHNLKNKNLTGCDIIVN
jgi:hypothetical protein